ncbi:hypothetical protein [Thaumasiovibrio sp. DFM-14]
MSYAIRGSRDWWGYSLGGAFTQLYGELRENAFLEHRSELYKSLEIEV